MLILALAAHVVVVGSGGDDGCEDDEDDELHHCLERLSTKPGLPILDLREFR